MEKVGVFNKIQRKCYMIGTHIFNIGGESFEKMRLKLAIPSKDGL